MLILYTDSLNKQHLFYPDYTLKLKNGQIYIIKAKGGEYSLRNSKNIDKIVENKFEALKRYCNTKGVCKRFSWRKDLI